MTILSGGQTGVDRAALDAALAAGYECGGWCPAGRAAEDGVIDARYPLRETPEADPAQRTEWNVQDATAVWVLLPPGAPSPGTALTVRLAARLRRPLLVTPPEPAMADVAVGWLRELRPRALDVAGPRESEAPGVYAAARAVIAAVLAHIAPRE